MTYERIPKYIYEGLGKQSSETLEEIVDYAETLIKEKQSTRAREDEKRRRKSRKNKKALEERAVATNPEEYEDVPGGAYVVIKEIDGRGYYYWQWREDNNSWGYQYITPVSPKER